MPAFGYVLLLNDNVHQYLTIKYILYLDGKYLMLGDRVGE